MGNFLYVNPAGVDCILTLQVKTEGYDGNDNQEVESASQWNFSGALLYSVTIITTIGKSWLLMLIHILFLHSSASL